MVPKIFNGCSPWPLGGIKQQLVEFLLQSTEIVAGTGDDQVASLGLDILARLTQPLGDEVKQTVAIDFAVAVTLQAEKQCRAQLFETFE